MTEASSPACGAMERKQRGQLRQLVALDRLPAAGFGQLRAVLAATDERDFHIRAQLLARRAQQLGAFLRGKAPEHDEAQGLGRCARRDRQLRHVEVDAVGNHMDRMVAQARLETAQRRGDRRRRHRDLDAPLQQALDEEAAHRVPVFARLVDENVVERIAFRAQAQILERAALAGLAELRVDGLADGVEVVADDHGAHRHGERIERMADERRDDDRLDLELADHLLQDAPVLQAPGDGRADRAGDVPGADRDQRRRIGVQHDALSPGLADAVRGQDHVGRRRIGAREIAHPPVEPAAPEMHDVQLDRARVEARDRDRRQAGANRVVHRAAQRPERMLLHERRFVERCRRRKRIAEIRRRGSRRSRCSTPSRPSAARARRGLAVDPSRRPEGAGSARSSASRRK